MNWREEAAEKLRRYSAMEKAVKNISQEISRLQLESTALRSPRLDGLGVRGGGGDREDALLNNIVRRQELKRTHRGAKLWVGMTARALEALTEEERLILSSLYIYPVRGALDDLCEKLQVEKSSIYRKRDKALERFTLALYGELEN